jgi:RimJ/RimL family protein N-acetyltransferase
MDDKRIETNRLILRRFEEDDIEAIYLLFSDNDVNTFLPWYPLKDMNETKNFYGKRLKDKRYCFAICLKDDDYPIGYVHAEDDDSHDFGYALRKEFWHRGIVSEASDAVIELLKEDRIPYITATHDKNNPRSGAVMKRIGMKYCYSYKEQWQPKNFPVIFRMYQLNFDGQKDRIYQKYWNLYDEHFIEADI